MGTSSDGILVFGIDFDESIPDSLLEGYEEDDTFEFDDYLAEEAGIEIPSEMAGTEKWSEYFRKKEELVKQCPVEIVLHCSYDYPCYIFSVPGTRMVASRGYPQEVDMEKLKIPQEKIDAMKKWFEDHNIEWSEPSWLLCSMYG